MKIKLFAFVLILALLSACGGPAASNTINIGGTYNLTGAMASLDVPASHGSLLAVKEINAAGGVLGKQIKYILFDGKTDSATNGNIATQLDQFRQGSGNSWAIRTQIPLWPSARSLRRPASRT